MIEKELSYELDTALTSILYTFVVFHKKKNLQQPPQKINVYALLMHRKHI